MIGRMSLKDSARVIPESYLSEKNEKLQSPAAKTQSGSGAIIVFEAKLPETVPQEKQQYRYKGSQPGQVASRTVE